MPKARVVNAAPLIPRHAATWTEEPDGRVAIQRKKFGRFGTFLLKLVRIQPTLTLRLDGLGSAAWKLMDGRNVESLIDGLEEQFPDEGRLTERVGAYLTELQRSGVMTLHQAITTAK